MISGLDVFGTILYAILTFMTAVSMLVFIEECIYIYKKVPPNKKSVIIWVTGAAPVRMEPIKFQATEDLGLWNVPSLFFCVFSDHLHHVVSGDVDSQIHHVYRYDFSLVGVSFPVILLSNYNTPWIRPSQIFKRVWWKTAGWLRNMDRFTFFELMLSFWGFPALSASAVISPSWCLSSWSWCWRRSEVIRPSCGGGENTR